MNPLPTTLRIAAALSLFAVLPGADASASPLHDKPVVKKTKGKHKIPHNKSIFNGKVEVDPHGKEFVEWHSKLEFEEAPPLLRARWSGTHTATNFAKWELHEVVGKKKVWVASGEVDAIAKVGGIEKFDFEPAAILPRYNDSGKDRRYLLRVYSNDGAVGSLRPSVATELIHKTKGSSAIPPEDPFSCGYSADKYARLVSVTVPFMTVHNTSNTAGDNDGQDEVTFHVSRWGPGIVNSQMSLPAADIGYAAHEGETVNPYTWHDDDGSWKPTPTLLFTTLEHGQSVTMSVLAMERDNVHLKAIKDGVILVNQVVSVVGKAIGGWGAVAGAAADLVIAGNEAFAPDTDSHDLLGQYTVTFTNKCGRIQSVWSTYGHQQVDGQTIVSEFPDAATHGEVKEFDGRSVSMFWPKDESSNFSPGGWDFGDYPSVGKDDAFMWRVKGTSQSHYTFVLLAQTNLPSNLPPGTPPPISHDPGAKKKPFGKRRSKRAPAKKAPVKKRGG